MTGRRIIALRRDGIAFAGVVEDGLLIDLFAQPSGGPLMEGAVFLGRVGRILKDRNAAFIDGPDAHSGLLEGRDARPALANDTPIGKRLAGGQALIVQVKAEAQGAKAATLTQDIALTAPTLVHLPLGKGVMVSRRLLAHSAEPKDTLRQRYIARLPASGGWIVRGAALTVTDDALRVQAEELVNRWQQLTAQSGGGNEPRILLPAPSPVERAQNEYAGAAPLPVDEADGTGDPAFDLDAELAGLCQPVAPLANGGSLVIERTAALTAIDVNGGGRGNPLAINLEAVPEIARQLRLRNIGGIVIVDFIDMAGKGERDKLLARLTKAVADDPAQVDVWGLTRLGLAEITRSRRGAALADLLTPSSIA